MNMQAKVTNADLVTLWDDLDPGDMVYFDAGSKPTFGIVQESTYERLTILTLDTKVVFDVASQPPLSEMSKNICKIPDFHRIQDGTIMSHIIRRDTGKLFREYARVVSAFRNEGALYKVEVEIINGVEKGIVYTFESAIRPLPEGLAGWQIED